MSEKVDGLEAALDMTREQVISTVSKGGPKACVALVELLESGELYPGPIDDIVAMSSDYSSAAFAYPVAAVAWAYLEAHKIARYSGDNVFIKMLIGATLDGSFCGRAYE